MKPPVCERKEHKITQHGQTRVDYYSWLRDENWKNIVAGKIEFKDDKVKKYIDAENSYKEFIMRPYKDTEKKVYDELLSRINENKESYPTRDNGYYYFEREKEGLNYPILCRFKNEKRLESVPVDYDYKAEKESAEVYFDVNKEAEGHDLYSFRRNDNNKSNSCFAYMYNLSGSMEGTLKVRDLRTGKDFPWSIQNTTEALHG